MKENKQWRKEKITVTLTRHEMIELANMLADGCRADYKFTKSRDRKVRKLFANQIKKRHDLWLKIINIAERQKKKLKKKEVNK